MTTGTGARILTVAGLCSAAVAVFHAVMVVIGARAYRYFGAGEEIATAAERGSAMPALLTLGIAVVFVAAHEAPGLNPSTHPTCTPAATLSSSRTHH